MSQEYQVRLTAETKSAVDKLDAVDNRLFNLTDRTRNIKLAVDTSALARGAEDTEKVARNIQEAANNIKASHGINIISSDSIAGATVLASKFYGMRGDIKGLERDLGKALGKTNVSEFMNSDKFLDRVIDNAGSRSKEIAETYKNLRELPGAADVLGPVENYARAEAWKKYGGNIADQTLAGMKQGFESGFRTTQHFLYGDLFDDIKTGTSATIDTLARVGLAIQGVQLLVGPLASAWGAAFDSIIGQNVRLEQTILSTQTTLASTGRILNRNTGQELTDPLEKINALGDDVKKSIESIRVRSLDLAGVTSSQIIDIFGVVATSISQVNGSIKDAEDLSISFTAALGTLGIPFYQARQEIGSILGGYITEDSLLAKRLQISNQDIEKAKQGVDGVIGYLKKKLEIAVAGQAISAKSFAGVLSNIQEVFEVVTQRIGAPLLQPLVSGLTVIYNILKSVQDIVSQVGGYLAGTLVRTLKTITDAFAKSNLIKSFQQGLSSLAGPYQELARSLELGLVGSGKSINLLQDWIDGVRKVPPAFEGLVKALISIGNFLKAQVSLIVDPIIKLLDQTRDKVQGGWQRPVQALSRAPQFLLAEGGDAFTKGWDTIGSTIQYAAKAALTFGTALARLKLIEFTATIRAAATVFELFGSALLGKINLALSVFDNIGNTINSWEIFGNNVAAVVVSFTAINRLLANTELFGLKSLVVWGFQTSKIFRQLLVDVGLFVKGFRDAGNISRIIAESQAASLKVLNIQAASGNPVIRNLAQIELLKKKLKELRETEQAIAAPYGTPGTATAILKNQKDIEKTTAALREAEKAQEGFTKAQRAGALIKTAIGGGAELVQAKEAARTASVMASGASSALALSSVLTTLGERLGLTQAQMQGLGGAVNVAAKSLKTFLTTTLLINLGFTAATVLISAVITAWQQHEQQVQRTNEKIRDNIKIQQILASGWTSVIKAAEGGDVNAQNRLDRFKEAAQTEFNIERENLEKLRKRRNDIENEQKRLSDIRKAQALSQVSPDSTDSTANSVTAITLGLKSYNLAKDLVKVKKEEVQTQIAINTAREALNKLQKEDQQLKDFEVLGERRKDLEDKIKLAREDFEKEINDKAFQSRMEVLGLEQQKRKEIQNQELEALRGRFSLLKANAGQENQRILDLAEQYAIATKTADDNSINRKQEYLQKEQQAKKAIEDYAFKLQREKVALEKQVGSYRKSVADYERKQSEIRVQQELQVARQKEVLASVHWKPYNTEQQQQFTNNARKITGLSTTDAYALLQLVGKDVVGVDGTSDANTVLTRLKWLLDQNKAQGKELTLESAVARSGLPADLATKLRQEAVGALNLERWIKPQNQETIKAPNLNIDYDGMTARIAALETSVTAALKDLEDAVAAGDKQKALEILKTVGDPSTLTQVKDDYFAPLAQSRAQLAASIESLKNFGKSVDEADQEVTNLDIAYKNAIRTYVNANYAEKDREQMIKYYTENMVGVPKTLQEQFLKAIQQAYLKGAQRIVDTRSARQEIDTNTKVKDLNKSIEQELASFKTTEFQQVITNFTNAVASAADSTYSLEKAQADVAQKTLIFFNTKLAEFKGPLTPENVAQLREAVVAYRNGMLETVKQMDPFNRALETYTNKIALSNKLTDTWVSGYKNFINDLVSGSKSIQEATAAFTDSLAKEFTSMFTEYVSKTVKDNFQQIFDKLLKVPDAKQAAENAMITALGGTQGATKELSLVIRDLITAITTPVGSTPPASPSSAATTPANGIVPLNVVPVQEGADAAKTVSETIPALSKATQSTTAALKKTADSASAVPKDFSKLQQGIGGAVAAFAGIAMSIAGIGQMKKGGTYNTLMGLAGIFGGIASLAGAFTPGGGLGKLFGFRAAGGPVSANSPYIVGENGPELFTPSSSGHITSNEDLFAGTRSALGGSRRSSPEDGQALAAAGSIDVRFESSVINNVEYVTAEQHRKGMQQAAERGRALAYEGLQRSVNTRRRLGV